MSKQQHNWPISQSQRNMTHCRTYNMQTANGTSRHSTFT